MTTVRSVPSWLAVVLERLELDKPHLVLVRDIEAIANDAGSSIPTPLIIKGLGWPYWMKPSRAAQRLMDLLQGADRWDPVDVTEAEVKKALIPVKAFLTRQGVTDHGEVLGL